MKKVKEDQQEILHALRIFDGKFEAICRTIFKVRVTVTEVISDKGEGEAGRRLYQFNEDVCQYDPCGY